MINIKNIFIIVILTSGLVFNLYSGQDDITDTRGDAGHGAPFLKLDYTARSVGFGGLTYLFKDGAGSVLNNPAGIAEMDGAEILLSTRIHGGVSRFYNFASVAFPLGMKKKIGIGIGIINSIIRGINMYDLNADSKGSANYFSNGAIISLGFPISKLRLGFNIKGLWETMKDWETRNNNFGGSIDTGLATEISILTLKIILGVYVQDVIGIMKWSSDDKVELLKQSFRIGLGLEMSYLKICAGIDKYIAQKSLVYRIGIEYAVKFIAIRFGVVRGEFNIGAGIILKRLNMDYAVSINRNTDEINNITSLCLKF